MNPTLPHPVEGLSGAPAGAGPVASAKLRYRGLGMGEVTLGAGYWGDLQDLNAVNVITHCELWMDRLGWFWNFDAAATGWSDDRHQGVEFADSEVYKLLEAMAWQLGTEPTATLEQRFTALVGRVASAQQPDGYLNTSFGGDRQPPRYSDLTDGHELYCYGHLIQAAVARLRTGHDDELVTVARRVVDHLVEEFGEGGRRDAVCGHPEIEVALVEFGRATGNEQAPALAASFVGRRGRGVVSSPLHSTTYYLDDMPVRHADVLRGHAVRALYLAAGALDVAVESKDEDLYEAVTRQWSNAVAARSYITGGMGSRHEDESFGLDFELPADRSYSETCAGVASVMVGWRLLLSEGNRDNADQIERVLLNTVLAAPRADGRAFFYANTLHQRQAAEPGSEERLQERAASGLRAPWFTVSCCPTNVARLLASVHCYFVTADTAGVQLQQYGNYDVSTILDDGVPVRLAIRSGYPYDGAVDVVVRGGVPAEFTLSLRIPAWAESAAVLVDQDSEHRSQDGYVRVRRVFRPGDRLRLELPMAARFTWPHPRVDAIRGQVAVERGPLVLALESLELPDRVDLEDVRIDVSAPPRTTARGALVSYRRASSGGWGRRTFGDRLPGPAERDGGDVELTAYSGWGNRGPSTMRVWLPHDPLAPRLDDRLDQTEGSTR